MRLPRCAICEHSPLTYLVYVVGVWLGWNADRFGGVWRASLLFFIGLALVVCLNHLLNRMLGWFGGPSA